MSDDILESPLDVAGEVRWFVGHGPAPVIGPCPHTDCWYLGRNIVAWGPSPDRAHLAACGSPGHVSKGCNNRCRAWHDQTGKRVTGFYMVDLPEVDARPKTPATTCTECKQVPGTRHLDGCSGQYREDYVGGDA